jgi:hypothetical protein
MSGVDDRSLNTAPTRRLVQIGCLVGCMIGYVVVRLYAATSAEALVFFDSQYYTLSSGMRQPGISAFFDAMGSPSNIALGQTLMSSLAALWLAHELRRWTQRLVRSSNWALASPAVLLLATMTKPVGAWDRMKLSESLGFMGCCVVAASYLHWRRTLRWTSCVLVLTSLFLLVSIRETLWWVFGPLTLLSLAVRIVPDLLRQSSHSTLHRRRASAVALVSMGLVGALASLLSAGPPAHVYADKGQSLNNFRTMNLIGHRILPSPSLRADMERAGMPLTEPQDQTFLFADQNDFQLYAIPGMLEFANNFPTPSYLRAELRDPGAFITHALRPFDSDSVQRALAYEQPNQTARLTPSFVDRLLFMWPSWLHLAAVALVSVLFGVGRMVRRSEWRGSGVGLWPIVAVVSTAGGLLAGVLDIMERPRHVLPFLVIARIAILLGLIDLALARLNRSGRVDATVTDHPSTELDERRAVTQQLSV